MSPRAPTAWSWTDVLLLVLGSLAFALFVAWIETPTTPSLSVLHNPYMPALLGAGMLVVLAAGLPLWAAPILALWGIALLWSSVLTLEQLDPTAGLGPSLMLLTLAALAQAWLRLNHERRLRTQAWRRWGGGAALLVAAIVSLWLLLDSLRDLYAFAQRDSFELTAPHFSLDGRVGFAFLLHVLVSIALAAWWLRWVTLHEANTKTQTETRTRRSLLELLWMPSRMRAPGPSTPSSLAWRASWVLSSATLICLSVGLARSAHRTSELRLFEGLGHDPELMALWAAWALARMLELGLRALALVRLSDPRASDPS